MYMTESIPNERIQKAIREEMNRIRMHNKISYTVQMILENFMKHSLHHNDSSYIYPYYVFHESENHSFQIRDLLKRQIFFNRDVTVETTDRPIVYHIVVGTLQFPSYPD